jgi:arylsulfatase A-like enzyme
VIWVWFEDEDLPPGVRAEGVVFPRCYAADARADQARRATVTGKFAHASNEGDPTLASVLKEAAVSYEEVSLKRDANAVALLEKARNSIVVFTRGPLEGNGIEKSIHVPLAIWYPAVLKPRVAEGLLISQVDLMPTLAALCGVDLPDGVQGRNLAPQLRGEGGEPPDSVFVEGNTWRAVIRGYQKLVTDLTGVPEHLYNIASDPDEQSDLVHDPGSRLAVDGLTALAQLWMRRLGDGLDPSGLKRR